MVTPKPSDFHQEPILAGKLHMNIVVEGPQGGPLVVMLHGFPEFWYSWRYQIKPLAQAGYRVVAPDMRGYNLTDKIGPYDALTLVEDLVHLIRALGYERAHIVGHDWGGLVAWVFAALHSDMTDKLIVCNLPHPSAVSGAIRKFYWPQLFKSWYIGFFQIPLLPEFILRAGNFAIFAASLRSSAPGHITDADIAYYRKAWAQPGALAAMLGYYRAVRTSNRLLGAFDLTVRLSARLIWGEPDIALDTQLAEWSVKYCPGLDLKIIRNSNHFVMQHQPEQVTDLMVSFFGDLTRK